MAFGRHRLLSLYRRRADHYDLAVWLYRLAGFRVDHYRRLTVSSLDLGRGDTVVDLGCGTGLNFSFLQEAVGPEGRIVGVDLTDRMLDVAASRVEREGWENVTLHRADLSEYRAEGEVDGALSTFAITLVPEYDRVIRIVAESLRHGGRLAVFDFKEPERWPGWLVRFAAWLNRPFGVTLDLAVRHPWESVRAHLEEVEYRELYLGAAYLSVGEARVSPGGTVDPRSDSATLVAT